MFMEFQEGGGLLELALLLAAPFGLDFAEVGQGFLELAREPLVVQAEGSESAVGIDDIEVDGSLLGRRIGGAVKEGGLKPGDTVQAPGGVDEFLGELSLGGGGGLVFVEKLAAVAVVGVGVLGSEDGGMAGEAVGKGISRRMLFAGGGAGPCGEERIGAVGSIASAGSQGLGVRD
ncbi:MAG: hypothetical protein JOZ32_06520 [Bryobacterales bacterium]|nr:hypothetical protein [Bryobacterales bacterium]